MSGCLHIGSSRFVLAFHKFNIPALEPGIQIYIVGCIDIHFLDVFQYSMYIDLHLCVHSSIHAYILCFYSIVYIFH